MKKSWQALNLEAWLPIAPANRRPPLLPYSLFHRGFRQLELPADAGSTSLAILPCSRNSLHASAALIKNYELVSLMRPNFRPEGQVGKFSIDFVFRYAPPARSACSRAAAEAQGLIHSTRMRARHNGSNLLLLGLSAPLVATNYVEIIAQNRSFRRCGGDTNGPHLLRHREARRRHQTDGLKISAHTCQQ
jgi:hypothetical protein